VAKLLSVTVSLLGWFSQLKLRWRLALVGLALLALFSVFESHEPSSETVRGNSGSDRMTEEESEAMYRKAMATLPNKQHTCNVCGGSGQVANKKLSFFERPKSADDDCETCSGAGTIRTRSGLDAACPTCGGLGHTKTTNCRNCDGRGFVLGW
jgi:DnaJ-class molecular chaperone